MFLNRPRSAIALVVVGFVVELFFTTQISTARAATSSAKDQAPYRVLAKVFQEKLSEKRGNGQFDDDGDEPPTIPKLTKTLSKLASNQQTFKGADGMFYEAYQRTHAGDDINDISVSGRAQRTATRLAAIAEALYACELIEIVEHPEISTSNGDDEDSVLHNKEILLNTTLGSKSGKSDDALEKGSDLSLSVLVIYEPHYTGGMGLEHGNLLSLTQSSSNPSSSESENRMQQLCKGGRLLVILGNNPSLSNTRRIEILDETPRRVKISSGLVTNEVASVQPELYKEAGNLLTLLEPQLRKYNESSVHFVGHSLAGGVANLAATILDGSIPMPKQKMKGKSRRKKRRKGSEQLEPIERDESDSLSMNKTPDVEEDENQEETIVKPLNGLGRARSSALTLGSPPCLSSNVVAAFCTSFIYGDDIVCRTTKDSISRLESRIEKTMHRGFVGKKLGWMSDTLSLTVSSLQSHAHGSEGEEAKLAIPGSAFLVKPRKLGGKCSIHEVGNMKKGGMREALFFQLNDILLSKSMFKHTTLNSYIQGLGRTQLRSVTNDENLGDYD